MIAGSADTLAHGAAAFTPRIARSVRDQCAAAGVPLWLKQVPGWRCSGCDTWFEEHDPNCGACCGPLQHTVIHSPWLADRPAQNAPEPIADILRREGKTA